MREVFLVEKVIGIALLSLFIIGGIGAALSSLASSPMFIGALIAATIPAVICLGLGLFAAAVFVARYAAMSVVDVRRKHVFVSPDAQGLLPVAEHLLQNPAFAAAVIGVHHAKAQQVPSSLHYSVKGGKGDDAIELPEVAQQWGVVPTFAELLGQGKVGNGTFTLGVDLDTGNHITADWTGLFSTGACGKQGTGKTSTVRNLLCQTLLNGAEVAVVDPHAVYSGDSLAQSIGPLHSHLHADIASDEEDILQMVHYIDSMMDARVATLKQDKSASLPPFLLIIDEMMSLLENDTVAPDLNKLIKRLVTERKLKVYMLAISHVFAANLFDKGSSFRALLGTRFVHTLDATQARILVSNDYAKQAETLERGQAILKVNMLGTYRVGIPHCTVADCEVVASILGGKTDTAAGNYAITPVRASTAPSTRARTIPSTEAIADSYMDRHFPNVGTGNPTAAELTAVLAASEREKRVVDMFLAGESQNAILKEVWGEPVGRAKVKASQEFNEIIRERLRGN
jgi:hypothetical protein